MIFHDSYKPVMRPCTCSVRALEVFVKDFAGLRIGRQRPTANLHRQRRFTTQIPYRHLGIVSTPSTDDGFIPFDFDSKIVQAATHEITSGGREADKTNRAEAEWLHADWHPEIEITGEETGTAGNEDAKTMKAVDHIELPNVIEATLRSSTATLTSLLPTVDSARQQDENAAPQKSRAASRLARKQRRVVAGTYKALSEARRDGETSAEQMNEVLGKIASMEGPSPIPAQNGKKKQRGAAEAAAAPADKVVDSTRRERMRASGNKSTGTDQVKTRPRVKKEGWQIQKEALEQKFGEHGWQPRKRLSPDTLDGIRALHSSDPASYTTATLAEHFKVTPEAIRRILKSKWRPNPEEVDDRRDRWEKRGVGKWTAMADQGARPPAKWRALGVQNPQSRAKKEIRGRRSDDDHAQWHSSEPEAERTLAERIL